MIDLPKRRARHRSEEDEIIHEVRDSHRHPVRSHASSLWLGIAGLALGAGTAVYGANQQKKANDAALKQNAAATTGQNDSSWNNYLMTRGISPTVPLAAGQMPTAGNFVATNTRLPLWAGYTTTKGAGGAPNSYSLATPDMGGYIGGPTEAELAAANAPAASSGGTKNKTQKAIALIDPGMAVISKKLGGNTFDPLNIF